MYKPDRIIHRGGYPHDADLPFDLNDPQEEQENLHGGIICIISKTCYQY